MPCSTRDQRGAGLVEAMIAMLVTAVVILGLAGLVLYGVRLQQLSRNTTQATAVALAEIERLRVLPSTAPEQQVGGSLDANVANHFRAAQPGLTTRWVVAAGPVNSRDLTVRVIAADPNVRPADVTVRMFP